MANKTRLNRELIQAMCERIRVGTYPYVAAAACGVAKSTFYRWMQTADGKRAPAIYRELRDKICEAAAAARSNAEVRVFRDRPFEWLRYGPGREKPGEPGWTETPQTLRVEGGNDPLRMQHQLEGQQSHLHVAAPDVAAALAILHRSGIIQPTPQALAVLEQPDVPESDDSPRPSSNVGAG